jgi:hypothetical protein
MKEAKVRGFFRLNIIDHSGGKPRIVGDSGWKKNVITNYGYETSIVGSVGSIAGSKQASVAALGIGTEPATNATALESEITEAGARFTLTPSAVSSKTLQFVGTFASGVITGANTKNIKNIGLFATSAQTVGTIIAGNTFAASTLQTNQSVNCSYQIRFS